MVVVLLVFLFVTYLIIVFGLTLWFEKYHYYRNTYFSQKTDAMDMRLSGTVAEAPIAVNQEKSNPRQYVKRGVHGRKDR